MTRQEQKAILESSFVWTEESIIDYDAAFLSHYHILNLLIEADVKCLEEPLARLAYFLHTEYMYARYSELCIIIECALKAVLVQNGYTHCKVVEYRHNLKKLFNELALVNNPTAKSICLIFWKA